MKKKSINILQTQRRSESDLRRMSKRYSIKKVMQAQTIKTNTSTFINTNSNSKTRNFINSNSCTGSVNNKHQETKKKINLKGGQTNFINDKTLLNNFCKRSKSAAHKSSLSLVLGKDSKKMKTKEKISERDRKLESQENITILLRNSNKIRKILWNQSDYNLPPIVISADFILDQDDFWEKSNISINCVKSWKSIHKNFFVIWVVKNQRSFIKMRQFINQNSLPINAIYYCKNKRKYTNDYSPVAKKISQTYGNTIFQINIIEVLKISDHGICDNSSFDGRIPIIRTQNTKICYVRVDQSPPGLDVALNMIKALSFPENLAVLTSVHQFINNYYQKLSIDQFQQDEFRKRMQTKQQQRKKNQYFQEEQAEQHVQRLKKSLIDTVIRDKGRLFTYEGNSVYYFIGDIIKRNYNLLVENALLFQKAGHEKKNTKQTDTSLRGYISNNLMNNKIEALEKSQIQERQKVLQQIHLPIIFYEYFYCA